MSQAPPPTEKRESADASRPSRPSPSASAPPPSQETEEKEGGEGNPEGEGGGENPEGGGGGGGGKTRAAIGRKGMLQIAASGLANGLVMLAITQGLSRLYFEDEIRATIVGISIALICSLVMLLGVRGITRFIVFYRFVLRAGIEKRPMDAFLCRWLEEVVLNGITLFLTLLLLAMSRFFV